MRDKLEEFYGKRLVFTGTFARFGNKTRHNSKPGKQKTVLIEEIKSDGKLLCEHCWFALIKGFGKLALKTGDFIMFEARVSRYLKGWKRDNNSRELDYRLSNPTKIKKIGKSGSVI